MKMQNIATVRLFNQLRSVCRFPIQGRSHLSRSFSDDSNSKKDEEGKEETYSKVKKAAQSTDSESAKTKLNILLQAIIKDDLAMKAEALKLSTAKSKKGAFKKVVSAAEYNLGKEMADAIVGVAKSMKGDKDQVQADLVDKVASMKAPVQEHTMEAPVKEQEMDPTEPINLSELLGGMQVDRTKSQPDAESYSSRATRVRNILSASGAKGEGKPVFTRRRPQRQFNRDEVGARAGLEDSVPLGIFTDPGSLPKAEPLLPIWEKMHQRELKLAVTYPPANIYEEMIVWTNQGKLWKFPIDNEQGWEKEKSVPFSEHVFLDKHLQDWCPKKGPVRHFMELVCIGLSKNPYFTVEEKKAHIHGYRDYFAGKTELLKEMGAL